MLLKKFTSINLILFSLICSGSLCAQINKYPLAKIPSFTDPIYGLPDTSRDGIDLCKAIAATGGGACQLFQGIEANGDTMDQAHVQYNFMGCMDSFCMGDLISATDKVDGAQFALYDTKTLQPLTIDEAIKAGYKNYILGIDQYQIEINGKMTPVDLKNCSISYPIAKLQGHTFCNMNTILMISKVYDDKGQYTGKVQGQCYTQSMACE